MAISSRFAAFFARARKTDRSNRRPCVPSRFATRAACALGLFATSFFVATSCHAANPQPYTIDIQSTGKDGLDAALHDSVPLVSLPERAPASSFALVARAMGDVGRLETALHSFGYCQGQATIENADHKPNDPELPNMLESLPQGTSARVKIAATLGPKYHLRRICLEGDVPDRAKAKIGFSTGQPAVAPDVFWRTTRDCSLPFRKADMRWPRAIRLCR